MEPESASGAGRSAAAAMGGRVGRGSSVGESPDFQEGLLVGILVGSGHFGGDGRQPQVTIRMHVRHEALFRWIDRNFPGAKLYGPYTHGGRTYFQWMARGEFLKKTLMPILERRITAELDTKAHANFLAMKERYLVSDSDTVARLGREALEHPHDEPHTTGHEGRRANPTS